MAELPIIRVPLEAGTVEELTRVATDRLRGEFFVPWEQPFPGGRVRVEATSAAVSDAKVRGVATVRAAMRDGRKGLMARLVNLDADSVRIPLGGLAPVVRVPTVLPSPAPARGQKITRPNPIATPPPQAVKPADGADDGGDFDDPTQTSRKSEQVARLMKTPAPVEKANVIRRNTPVPMNALKRPPTAQLPLVAPPEKAPAAAAPVAPTVAPTAPTAPAPEPEPESEEVEPDETQTAMPDLIIEEKSIPVEAERPPAAKPARSPAPAPAPAPPLSMKPGQIALAEIARSGPTPAPRRRRPRALIAAAIAAAVTIAIIVMAVGGSSDSADADAAPSALEERLVQADTRMREGRLAGPGGDQALDHLLAARKLAPEDARVRDRLGVLADTFEQLADGALAAGDLTEAAAHLQAAVNAQPDRGAAVTKLRDVEQRVRDQQR